MTDFTASFKKSLWRSMQAWETLIWENISTISTRTQVDETTELLKWMAALTHRRAASRTFTRLMSCKKVVWTASSQWSKTCITIVSAWKLGFSTIRSKKERTDSLLTLGTRSIVARCEGCLSRGGQFRTKSSKRGWTTRRLTLEWNWRAKCSLNGQQRLTSCWFTCNNLRTRLRWSKTLERGSLWHTISR